jgi:hypothetical protein
VSSPFDSIARPETASSNQIIADRLHEPIGLVGDWDKGMMYVAELDGCIWEIGLEKGSGKKEVLREGGYFTGIALV